MYKFLFAVLFFVLSLAVQSQSFQFIRTSPEVVGGSFTDTVIISYGKIVNLTSDTLRIRLHRTASSMPFGWLSSLCDIYTCYPKWIDSTAYNKYPPGESEVKVKFYPDVHHNGIASVTVQAHLLNSSENYKQVFSSTLGPIGLKNISSEAVGYFLAQNYPNPFNPFTIIKFGVNTDQIVDLVVYNSAGQQIDHPVNARMGPGVFEVEYNAGNLTSGIFFYRLITGNYTEMKKMVLIK